MPALYLTHPQVVIDPAVPVPDWGLSAEGRARLAQAAARPWAQGLARVVASPERKARETAAILAAAAGIEPDVVEGLGEIDRSATGYLPHDEHEAAADALFAHPDHSHRGWETARAAQARILGGVRAALEGTRPTPSWPWSAMAASARCCGRRWGRADRPPGRAAARRGLPVPVRPARRPPALGWIAVEAWDGALPERTGNI